MTPEEIIEEATKDLQTAETLDELVRIKNNTKRLLHEEYFILYFHWYKDKYLNRAIELLHLEKGDLD